MKDPYPPDGSPWYGQIVPVRFGSSFKTIAEQAVVGPNVNVAGGGGAFCAFTVQAKKNTTNQNSISSNAIRFFILSFSFLDVDFLLLRLFGLGKLLRLRIEVIVEDPQSVEFFQVIAQFLNPLYLWVI